MPRSRLCRPVKLAPRPRIVPQSPHLGVVGLWDEIGRHDLGAWQELIMYMEDKNLAPVDQASPNHNPNPADGSGFHRLGYVPSPNTKNISTNPADAAAATDAAAIDATAAAAAAVAAAAATIHSCQTRVTLVSAWPANEHTLLVIRTHPGGSRAKSLPLSVPKLAEWGMGSAWSDEDLPSSVPQSHKHSQREHKQDSLRVGSSN